ncbi:hypothetical protein SAMN02745248_01917 [Hathewaya proteolytica DSM 3090]|uniref:Uncharacterized protein n=1 Tax=Hathewaya proteolytica DSM 3090 TaxID=1121331 RepID=A0A1M6Q6U5_9CLOT|nr:hypothetical protein [Hathewaya proteolytica]SHK15847.1 hypothetical protein SAMN02745248_01917 [Hathewaya proteolytica DSM 3090]
MPNCCFKPKMNCCCCQPQQEPMYVPVQPCLPQCASNNTLGGKSGCSFSCLIILILILLVFSNTGRRGIGPEDGCGCEGESFLGGKGIIFIIALFYLSCVSPCGSNC